jgi:hypothetical protein
LGRRVLFPPAIAITFSAFMATQAPVVLGETSVPDKVPASCPVTLAPTSPLIPPSPYPPNAPGQRTFWYGSAEFWIMLKEDGIWRGVPPDQGYRKGYRNKLFWWRPGYDGRIEQRPELSISGRRIDGEAPPLHVPNGTNAHLGDFGGWAGWAMLVAPDIPTQGCWELTGRYREHELTFVVWVPASN